MRAMAIVLPFTSSIVSSDADTQALRAACSTLLIMDNSAQGLNTTPFFSGLFPEPLWRVGLQTEPDTRRFSILIFVFFTFPHKLHDIHPAKKE